MDAAPRAWPSIVSIISGVCTHAAVSLFYSPVVVVFAFAVFAFAFPSGISACLLVLALCQLLMTPHTGVQPLTSHADSLILMLSGWFCMSYCVASISMALSQAKPWMLSASADEISGFYKLLGYLQALICYDGLKAFLPLATTASFAFIIAAVAAHARGHNAGSLWSSIRSRTRNAAATGASDTPRGTSNTSSHFSTSKSLATTLLVHALGNIIVPALWFALGMFRFCPAGVVYAVGPAAELLPFQALVATPQGPQSLSLSRHLLMRSYAALHIALLDCLWLVPLESMPGWMATARGFLAGALTLPCLCFCLIQSLLFPVGSSSSLAQSCPMSKSGPQV